MKKFIIFRTDRLGDFLIISSILKAIKKRYPESHITVVGSELNYKIIKSYKIIDRVLIYNKYYSITKKIKIFKDINKTKYYCSLSLDGKSFSNIVNFFLKAEIKLGVSYKFNLLSPFLKWSKPNFLYNYLIFDKFEFFSSKKSLYKIEHLPSILIKLSNNLQLKLKKKDPYFFEVKKSNNLIAKNIFKKKIMGKFILIHLDEKWNDIKLIEKDFFSELLIFQKKNEEKNSYFL